MNIYRKFSHTEHATDDSSGFRYGNDQQGKDSRERNRGRRQSKRAKLSRSVCLLKESGSDIFPFGDSGPLSPGSVECLENAKIIANDNLYRQFPTRFAAWLVEEKEIRNSIRPVLVK